MAGTIFLTGGAGKTASRIASKLQTLNIPVLLSSRKGQAGVPASFKAVTFNWFDEATHVHPFDEDENIKVVYIVVPDPVPAQDSAASVKQFIDLARKKGVNKFVLMSGVTVEKGSMAPQGQLHAYLEAIGVDYAVLRPTFFFGNFLYGWPLLKTTDEITTAAADGKIGFISEDDIADIAVQFLTSQKPLGGVEPILVGPESLSYDQIAEQLSEVLGRKITHRKVSVEERKSGFMTIGVANWLAGMLASSEANFHATGREEKMISEKSDKAIGKTRFIEFAEANKAAWQK